MIKRVPTRHPAGSWRRTVMVLLAAVGSLALTVPALAKEPLYTGSGLALSGYDAVAYFSDGKPVKGRPEHETEWGGARWRFASADPTAWRIVRERLYVNYSNSVQGLWEQDIPGNIDKANGNWPAVLTR